MQKLNFKTPKLEKPRKCLRKISWIDAQKKALWHYTLPYFATKVEPYHNGCSNKDFLIVAIIYRSDWALKRVRNVISDVKALYENFAQRKQLHFTLFYRLFTETNVTLLPEQRWFVSQRHMSKMCGFWSDVFFSGYPPATICGSYDVTPSPVWSPTHCSDLIERVAVKWNFKNFNQESVQCRFAKYFQPTVLWEAMKKLCLRPNLIKITWEINFCLICFINKANVLWMPL